MIRTLANQRIAKADTDLVLHKLRSMDLELNFEAVASTAPHIDDLSLSPMVPLLPQVRTIIALMPSQTKEEWTMIVTVTQR